MKHPERGHINETPLRGLVSTILSQKLANGVQDGQSLSQRRVRKYPHGEAGGELRRIGHKQKHTGIRGNRNKTSFSFTDEERETLRRGLRILARLIVRTHMRRQLTGRQAGSERKDKDHAP